MSFVSQKGSSVARASSSKASKCASSVPRPCRAAGLNAAQILRRDIAEWQQMRYGIVRRTGCSAARHLSQSSAIGEAIAHLVAS
eukprot:471099-Pelagomonas_calceolata.AAC.4